MRKPRILPSLPGLPGSSLPVIVLSFLAAWRSPGAGMAESGLLHPRHPPRVSGEAEAQECPVHHHVARQQPAPGTGELEHCRDVKAAGESFPGLQLQQPSQQQAQHKAGRQTLHPGGRGAPAPFPATVPCWSPPGHGPVAAVPSAAGRLGLHSTGSVQGVTAQLLLAYAGLEPCPLSPETQCPRTEVTWEHPALCNSAGRAGGHCEGPCLLRSARGLG